MTGGYKTFGPTYNATKYVRVLHEGMINGSHNISETLVASADAPNGEASMELAGKIAAITTDGVGLADKGAKAVGLFTEDMQDMVNASFKASFYFRGGEYLVAEARLGMKDGTTKTTIADLAVGDELTTDANGGLIKFVKGDGSTTQDNGIKVGVVTSLGEFPMGNMYEWAGTAANGGNFVGFILYL